MQRYVLIPFKTLYFYLALHNSNNDYEVGQFMKELSQLFSKLITVVVNEQIKEEHSIINSEVIDNESKNNTILSKLNSLWKNLIPDIIFEMDTTNRTLIPMKNNQQYSLNAMSDGEKAILYYICQILLAEENSFIVVDEPETFLNASNFNRLWDTLESYRRDCRFIYISHVIDFIVTRSNADLLWCKSYTYPDKWDIKNLEYEDELSRMFPKELLSEILGARKPILFCEGKKDKLDYIIYNSVFRDEVIVCPVDGHNQVIQYTRAYNKSPILSNNSAFGIIDADLMSEEQISSYEEEGIFTLPFNEIEMILFTEEVMCSVLEGVYMPEEVKDKIQVFKDNFFNLVEIENEAIVQQKLKKHMDNELSNYRINNLQTGNEMVSEVKEWLDNLNLPMIEEAFSNILQQINWNSDYRELLKVSPQKNSISKGLANKFLDSKYEEKAKNKIKLDKTLSNLIKENYFSHITFK
ncbi:DUF4435 domain-containing protein [Sporosarcina ureae]|uniref:DUF4435 domain-containing protein n=1 Tax=Sporosarcina ureae TaxID=1571 RepID=UPI0009DC77CA|nr:DUF4435 domain-containing protein [Sporosarcina ureae]ARF18217.1 hypothetical protein SporoP17a_13570 [Sporosarcina ureae]